VRPAETQHCETIPTHPVTSRDMRKHPQRLTVSKRRAFAGTTPLAGLDPCTRRSSFAYPRWPRIGPVVQSAVEHRVRDAQAG
jgi:hypothetical protein